MDQATAGAGGGLSASFETDQATAGAGGGLSASFETDVAGAGGGLSTSFGTDVRPFLFIYSYCVFVFVMNTCVAGIVVP